MAAQVIDLALMAAFFVVGWLLVFATTAMSGQSPGKSLMQIRCIRVDGREVSAPTMWCRDGVAKLLLGVVLVEGLLGLADWDGLALDPQAVLVAVGVPIVAFAWALVDKDNQTFFDKMFNTVVVAPGRTAMAMLSAASSEEMLHWTTELPPAVRTLVVRPEWRPPRATGSGTYPVPPDRAWEAVLRTLRRLNIVLAEADEKSYLATGFAPQTLPFGEAISVKVKTSGTDESEVTVESASRIPTTRVDWGKNQRNLEAFFAKLEGDIGPGRRPINKPSTS